MSPGPLLLMPSERYDSLIQYYASREDLDWQKIKNQIRAESSFYPRAVSSAGAKGLAQFMDDTWRWLWEREGVSPMPDPFNPEASIHACCIYMRYLHDAYAEIENEDERHLFAAGAYNAGRSNINQALLLARVACGLPGSFHAWIASGRPSGPWQSWDFTKRFLREVTGRHHEETLRYIERIRGGY